MKILALFLFLIGLTGCHKNQVEPTELVEVKATILGYGVGFVACSGGYIIQDETDVLSLAHSLPAPYDDYNKLKYPTTVWIRHKEPTGDCKQFPGLIDVVSIRAR